MVLVLAAGLVAGTAVGKDVQEEALRATLDAKWAQATALWAQVEGPRARQYLQQARSELQHERTQPLLNEALSVQQEEDWAAADLAYLKALTVSPHLKAAHQGRGKIAAYLEAHRRLAALNLPDGLYERVVQARAKEWLAYLDENRLNDRKLAKARTDLVASLRLAQAPVTVTLTSDGQSELDIYGVGKLGRLERQTLQLAPGDYIAVATRAGFRDARATLRVRPREAITLDLRCTESIR